jgi:integrase
LIGRLGFPKVRFHDLGHCHASQFLEADPDLKIVQERFGPTRIAVILGRYSHVVPGRQEDAAIRVDRALRTALGKLPRQGF